MLKTNSKKAAENLRAYILNRFTPEGYTDNPPQDWQGVSAFILNTFRNENITCRKTSAIIATTSLPPSRTGAQGFPECLILVIITTAQPLTISAQSLKRRTKKKHDTPKNKPRKC